MDTLIIAFIVVAVFFTLVNYFFKDDVDYDEEDDD